MDIKESTINSTSNSKVKLKYKSIFEVLITTSISTWTFLNIEYIVPNQIYTLYFHPFI